MAPHQALHEPQARVSQALGQVPAVPRYPIHRGNQGRATYPHLLFHLPKRPAFWPGTHTRLSQGIRRHPTHTECPSQSSKRSSRWWQRTLHAWVTMPLASGRRRQHGEQHLVHLSSGARCLHASSRARTPQASDQQRPSAAPRRGVAVTSCSRLQGRPHPHLPQHAASHEGPTTKCMLWCRLAQGEPPCLIAIKLASRHTPGVQPHNVHPSLLQRTA